MTNPVKQQIKAVKPRDGLMWLALGRSDPAAVMALTIQQGQPDHHVYCPPIPVANYLKTNVMNYLRPVHLVGWMVEQFLRWNRIAVL